VPWFRKSGNSPAPRARLAAVLLVVSLAIWLLSIIFRIDLNKAVALATVGGTVIALVAIWMTSGQVPAADGGAECETRAADDLTRVIRSQWQREVSAMGVQLPRPLLVRWSLSELAQGPRADTNADRRLSGGSWLTGDVTELADAYQSLPSPHLVVLGPAGSGKTVLALLTLLQLATDRHEGEAVPVFLSAASWNPEAEQFSVWVTRSLIENYPALGNMSRYGDDAAGRLVAANRLLLVLDGLDELPERLRSTAVSALDAITRAGQKLIVTCRSAEYLALEAARGHPPLVLASVVELEPVDIAEASRYLRSASPKGGQRWDKVVDQAQLAPQGALARALSLPLTVYLAGVAYGSPTTDPADLIEISRSGETAIEENLLDLLIPTLYRNQAAKDLSNGKLASYPPGKARKWLMFLAHQLVEVGTSDLAWWQLTRGVKNWRTISRMAFGILYGTVSGLAVGFLFGLCYGIAVGLSYGCVAGLVYGSDDSASPQRLDFNITATVSHFRDNLTGCVTVGVAVGLVIGLVDAIFAPSRSAATAGLAFGGASALIYGLMGSLRATLDELHAVTPQSVLRADRAAVLLYRLVTGAVYVALGIALTHPGVGVRGGIVFGLGAALLQGFVGRLAFKRVGRETAGSMSGGAWFRYSVARCWLACSGNLPWRLLRFLDDAHTRGLLRQSGAAYQFRHPRLQKRLSDAYVAASLKSDPAQLLSADRGAPVVASARRRGSRKPST